jgi:hypothetical protein
VNRREIRRLARENVGATVQAAWDVGEFHDDRLSDDAIDIYDANLNVYNDEIERIIQRIYTPRRRR